MKGILWQLSRAFSAGTQANPEKHFSPLVLLNTQKSVGNFKQKIKTAQSHTREETDLSGDVAKLNIKERPLWAGGSPLWARVTVTRTLLMLIRLYHGFVFKKMPVFFPEKHPHPNWFVLLRKSTPEPRGLHDLLLRRGSGQGIKCSWLFFLGQRWGGPFHTFQTTKASVSQRT